MKKSFTVDDKTFASNPGNISLKPFVWIKYNVKTCFLLAASLLVACLCIVYISFWFLTSLIVILFVNLFYWRRKIEHFKLGDSNGGLVISKNPTLIAVTTDLTKGIGKYPVIKIIRYKKKAKIGDRIATVALYTASTDPSLPNWIDFDPIPLDYATDDSIEIDRATKSYSEKQWIDIERRLTQLKTPYKEGLFKVDSESSDWK